MTGIHPESDTDGLAKLVICDYVFHLGCRNRLRSLGWIGLIVM